MIKIAGFVPDADPTTPGVLLDCENLIPGLNGMEGAPSPLTPLNVPVLADPCAGAAVVTKLNNARRTLAGTQDALYELVAGAWVDQSEVGGYTGGVDSRWVFAQFGDASLAANGADVIQRSTDDVFSNITGAPIAEIIFSVGAFVMALNVNDGSEKADGWHCCAAFDDTDWTESTATQSASGRLVSSPGELTAGGRLGDFAVAYKNRSLYLGQYVGAPVVWDWQLVSGGSAGCVGKNAWCDIDGSHFFVGEDNFWLFDGTTPRPIADGILRNWFNTDCSQSSRYKIICAYDKPRNLVWVVYPSTSSTTLDSIVVYHVLSQRWGRANRSMQAAVEYVTSSITIDDLDDYASTIDSLPEIPFDSPYWLSGSRSFAFFNDSNQLQSLSGGSAGSSMTTGDVGDDDQVTLLQQIRLRFISAPTGATVQCYGKMDSGSDNSLGPFASMNDGKFDVLQSFRWHSGVFNFTGDVSVTGLNAKLTPDGMR